MTTLDKFCSTRMTIIPTLNAQGTPSGEDGDILAPPGNEEAAKCPEPLAKVELINPADVEPIDHSIVIDVATFLNRLVRAHPIRIGVGQIRFQDKQLVINLQGWPWYKTFLAERWGVRNVQVRDKDLGWAKFVLDHLPDDEEEDDLTHDNNRWVRHK